MNTMTTTKQLLTVHDALVKMSRYKMIVGEEYASSAYAKAADIVNSTSILDRILSSPPSTVRGVGEGIKSFIAEIIAQSSSTEMENMRADPRIIAAEMLEEIIGVGPMTAMKWVAEGYMTVDDARRRKDLTNLQRIGLEVHGKVMKRVPRKVVEDTFTYVTGIILGREVTPSGRDGQKRDERDERGMMKMMITGSYRRGSRDSGDVDILVVIPDDIIIPARSLPTPADAIILTSGEMKTSFLVPHRTSSHTSDGRPRDDALLIQVDIFVSPQSTYIPYLLYSTGSAEHNIYIRGLAKSKGMHLTQYALTKDGKKMVMDDEKDVYRILGIDYVPPEKR